MFRLEHSAECSNWNICSYPAVRTISHYLSSKTRRINCLPRNGKFLFRASRKTFFTGFHSFRGVRPLDKGGFRARPYGSEPNAPLLGRKKRDASRGSPGSFAAQKKLAQNDNQVAAWLAVGLFDGQFCALEADAAVGAVAKRFVHRAPATAERK